MTYKQFIASKRIFDAPTGFDPGALPGCLFDFQSDCVRWACRRGRAALLEDCGLGKTPQQLVWAHKGLEQTGRNKLIATPLGVTRQTVREGEKFGIEARIAKSQADVLPGITVTNYERLHLFDPSQFDGFVADESSILKNYAGATRNQIIEFSAKMPYRLACSATAAPNDYMELGNHAEFLGVMSRTEMLATFFVHDGGETSKWRLKGHAEKEFWKWLCTWAINLRRPSDLGYEDGKFILPPLNLKEHVVHSSHKMDGYLFALPASSLAERRNARKVSLPQRCQKAFELIYDNHHSEEGISSQIQACEPAQVETKPGAAQEGECRKKAEICDGRSASGRVKNGGKEMVEGQSQKETKPTTDGEIRHQSGRSGQVDDDTAGQVCDLRIQSYGQPANVPIGGSLPQDRQGAWTSLHELQPGHRQVKGRSVHLVKGSSIPDEQWIVWCNLNCEQDELAKLLGKNCVSIKGSTGDEDRILLAEMWQSGAVPVLISKPSIFGFGMNWQHCRNVIFLGLSDSYEEFYQALRRCWRFGQTQPVNAHVIISDLEGAVLANIKRKESDANRLSEEMVRHMADISSKEIKGAKKETIEYKPKKAMRLPAFV